MKTLLLLLVLLMIQAAAQAQEADAIRGGWVAAVDGRTQVYLLIVRGTSVTGTQCVDCTQPRNLGFILGQVDAAGAHFAIRHEAEAGKATFEDVIAVPKDRELVLTLQRRHGAAHPRTITLQRATPPSAAAGAPPGARVAAPYVAPGPAQPLSADQVLGLWLFGAGPGKQYFIIRRAGPQLLGLVCGPCDNPYSMAPLDGFVIDGTDLRFNIVHEDTGGADVHGPFSNVAHATLARNELHLKVIPSYEPPDSTPIEMTLLGPVIWRP
jgi:hypothetical protein